MARALLKGRCDFIAASVFNPDTTYFSNIIDSATRDYILDTILKNFNIFIHNFTNLYNYTFLFNKQSLFFNPVCFSKKKLE